MCQQIGGKFDALGASPERDIDRVVIAGSRQGRDNDVPRLRAVARTGVGGGRRGEGADRQALAIIFMLIGLGMRNP
jgi:hypothetical protein